MPRSECAFKLTEFIVPQTTLSSPKSSLRSDDADKTAEDVSKKTQASRPSRGLKLTGRLVVGGELGAVDGSFVTRQLVEKLAGIIGPDDDGAVSSTDGDLLAGPVPTASDQVPLDAHLGAVEGADVALGRGEGADIPGLGGGVVRIG